MRKAWRKMRDGTESVSRRMEDRSFGGGETWGAQSPWHVVEGEIGKGRNMDTEPVVFCGRMRTKEWG